MPEKLEHENRQYTPEELKAVAIEQGWSAEQFELACLRSARPSLSSPGLAVHVHDRQVNAEALSAALLRSIGVPQRARNRVTGKEYGLERMFRPEVLEESHRPQYRIGCSIQALLDLQIRAAGQHYPGLDRRSSDFIQAAVQAWETVRASGFSTLNITQVLGDVMHKAALAAFEAVEVVWPFICGRRPLNDFRPHNLYRLSFDGSFRRVGPDGELKHISLTDERHQIEADTYGAVLTIDRRTIANDDLGLVLDQARALGSLAAQRIEESVFVLLLSNPNNFYSTGNGNLMTGPTSALGVDALSKARELFRNQTVNGKPIGVSPAVLLVPTTLETTANRLWAEERLAATGSTDQVVFVNNPHKGLYRPYVSPYLNNTNILDQDGKALSGQSDTQWYLFGDPNAPQGASIMLGFIDGRETPYFDEAETEFTVPGGLRFRSYLDWGVAMHVPQLSVKSTGA